MLECSHELTTQEVYDIYRRRDIVEKLTDSLKNNTEIKPLRVWSESSVRGVLLLCFLAQVIVSMMRHENPGIRRRLTRFIIRSLEKLTVTHIPTRDGPVKRVFSNFNPMNLMISGDSVVEMGVPGD